MPAIRNTKDFYAGVLFSLIAIGALYSSASYGVGSLRRMGPGFFPIAVSLVLCLFAATLMWRGIAGEGQRVGDVALRVPVLILGGTFLFALTIRPLGLPFAIAAMVMVGSRASRQLTFGRAAMLATVLAIGSVLVFRFGLGQPIPVCGALFAEAICGSRWM
ncbi:tripartite tricarboxylate transporter TctB family protein [Mesorhizobium sp. ANAO-SY3R2]|uniref:tripartite tricarboxylate transporter TctB family protein n=1 Tax=Mesorhizobium sp. ANAO-SY3R2 TaxID=3166644 RepID=UPI00366D838D